MPKLFEYLGILVFFYANEHEPIHVHARKGEYESKAEILIVDGNIEQIVIRNVKGKKPLKGKDVAHLKVFLTHYADSIVQKWIDFFVYRKDIEFEKITKRL